LEQNVGTGQAGGPGSNERHALAAGRAERNHVTGAAALKVHCEGFQLSSENRLAVLVVHARSLAQLLMRADSAADFRKGTGLVI